MHETWDQVGLRFMVFTQSPARARTRHVEVAEDGCLQARVRLAGCSQDLLARDLR